METTIMIEGMQCGGCADRIRWVLEREPGVREAEVSHPEGRFVGDGVRRVECP